MRFFAYDGPLAQFARYVGKLMYLNLCFILCSLPLVTFGSAVTALYAAFLNEEQCSSLTGNYIRQFAQNFKKSTIIWLVFLVVGALLTMAGYLLQVYQIPGGGFLRILLVILIALYVSVSAYVFPLQAHYENTVGRTIKNSCVLGVGMILPGIIMAVINFLPLVLLIFDIRLFIMALSVWVFIGFSLSAQINSWLLKIIFHKIQPAQQQEGA